MHPDVQSLLALQVDDLVLYGLEDRLASLAPRRAALEREREKVGSQLERTRATIAGEESRHREALLKTEGHRALVERSQRAYESVTSPREAAAAMTQLEQTKRMVADSEHEAAQVQGRINELRHQAADLETALADVETRQAEARTALADEEAVIAAEMNVAREKRTGAIAAVPKAILFKYDRIRLRKRGDTLVPLRGTSCSACDTAIPTQRRAAMSSSGAIEMCEGCGALIYAVE